MPILMAVLVFWGKDTTPVAGTMAYYRRDFLSTISIRGLNEEPRKTGCSFIIISVHHGSVV